MSSVAPGYPIAMGFRIKNLGLNGKSYGKSLDMTRNKLKLIYDKFRHKSDGVTIYNDFNLILWKKFYGITESSQLVRQMFASWCYLVLKHYNIHFDMDECTVQSKFDAKMKIVKKLLDSESEKSDGKIKVSYGDKACYDMFTSFGVDPSQGQNSDGTTYALDSILNPAELFIYCAMMGKIYYHAPSDYVRKSSISICAQDVPAGDFQFIFDDDVMGLFGMKGSLLRTRNVDQLDDTNRQFSDGSKYYWIMYESDLPRRELEHIVKDYANHVVISKAVESQFSIDEVYVNFTKSLDYILFVARCVQNAQIWFGKYCEYLNISPLRDNSQYLERVINLKKKSRSSADVSIHILPHRKISKRKELLKIIGVPGISNKKYVTEISHTWDFGSNITKLAETVAQDRHIFRESKNEESLDRMIEIENIKVADSILVIDAINKKSDDLRESEKNDYVRSKNNIANDDEEWLDDEDLDDSQPELSQQLNRDVTKSPEVDKENIISKKTTGAEISGITRSETYLKDDKNSETDILSANTNFVLGRFESVGAQISLQMDDSKDTKEFLLNAYTTIEEQKIDLDSSVCEELKKTLKSTIESHTIIISPTLDTNTCDGPNCYAPLPLYIPDVMDITRLAEILEPGSNMNHLVKDDHKLFSADDGESPDYSMTFSDNTFENEIKYSFIPQGMRITKDKGSYRFVKYDKGGIIDNDQFVVECATSV